MADEFKVDLSLDLRGLACPLPVVRVGKSIKDVPVGGIVEAIATDPGALADFPAWAKTTGHEILKTERNGADIKFYIRRVK
ncbi:MAG: sulfurtransferase TusA family protein [Bacillota bacterium]|nr:sulfurtransferase TusA family protein [Bacillota bacterium]